jgi:hypothetical protein
MRRIKKPPKRLEEELLTIRGCLNVLERLLKRKRAEVRSNSDWLIADAEYHELRQEAEYLGEDTFQYQETYVKIMDETTILLRPIALKERARTERLAGIKPPKKHPADFAGEYIENGVGSTSINRTGAVSSTMGIENQ